MQHALLQRVGSNIFWPFRARLLFQSILKMLNIFTKWGILQWYLGVWIKQGGSRVVDDCEIPMQSRKWIPAFKSYFSKKGSDRLRGCVDLQGPRFTACPFLRQTKSSGMAKSMFLQPQRLVWRHSSKISKANPTGWIQKNSTNTIISATTERQSPIHRIRWASLFPGCNGRGLCAS